MKTIIKISMLSIIFLSTLILVIDVNAVTNRKNELEDSITLSMWNTMKSTKVNKMYEITDEEMQAEYIRNLAQTINTNSTIDVYMNEVSTNGILDIKLRSTFNHINGKTDSRETRKTLIYESYDAQESE